MHRRRLCLCILCAVAAAIVAALLMGPTAVQAQPADRPVSFIDDVAPILKENCFACHDARKRSGKLDLTTVERLRAGGSSGAVVVPGKPVESDLYALIVAGDDSRMPPRDKGEAVPREQAAVIERWIRDGAKIDAGLDVKADLVRELRLRWKPPTPPAVYPYPVVVTALAFAPDGKSLVIGGHHELTVWSVADGRLMKRIRTRASRTHAMIHLPGGPLVVAGGRPGQEGDVRVYDLTAKGTITNGVEFLDGVNDPRVLLKRLLETGDSVLCLAVSADGRTLAAGGCDRAVRIWDLSAGLDRARLVQTVENHADWVLGVSLSADGKLLATAGRDRTAKVWDIAAKESVMTFPEHQSAVFDVALSADGKTGFSVGADRNLRSWKPTGEGKQLKAAGGHGDEVFRVALHPRQPILATASRDRTVRLWDAARLGASRTLSGFADEVFAVAFSPDGSLVAAGSYDGEVRIWKVADGTAVRAFNASPGIKPKAAPGTAR